LIIYQESLHDARSTKCKISKLCYGILISLALKSVLQFRFEILKLQMEV